MAKLKRYYPTFQAAKKALIKAYPGRGIDWEGFGAVKVQQDGFEMYEPCIYDTREQHSKASQKNFFIGTRHEYLNQKAGGVK